MFNIDTLQVLTDIRVDLLRYWSTEKDDTIKEVLSKHMNSLDELIISKKKQLEKINSVGGYNGK